MKILVLNCGGSSMKYQIIDMDGERVCVKGKIDRLGTDRARLVHETAGKPRIESDTNIRDYAEGISFVTAKLKEDRVIRGTADVSAVAHKLAHGGKRFRDAVLITDEVLDAIRECSVLAPVHNPPGIRGIEVCRELLPGIPQVGVFETAFHATIPDYAYMYGVPYEWYEKYGVRKYGFHGASHSFVVDRAAAIVGRPKEDLKIVSCHLGSGTSVACVMHGKSLDISSGFTPQSGTIMSTRPGDFDPWVLPYLMERTGLSVEELSRKLVREGGLLGISGVSGDMRDIEEAAARGNDRARLALDVFCYHVKRYIGSFVASMNGIDVLIFTGGIGENDPAIRARIADRLDYLGIVVDGTRNQALSGLEGMISPEGTRVKVLVIPTDEERVVARQAAQVLWAAGRERNKCE